MVTLEAGQIKAFVVERLMALPHADPRQTFEDDLAIVGSGLLDSLGFLELLSSVEEKFGLQCDFSEAEPEVFTTLGGFVKQFGKYAD